MGRIIIIVVVVLAVLGFGGYFGVGFYADHRLAAGIDEALSHVPAGYTASHGPVHYDMLNQRGTVHDIVIKHNVPPLFSVNIATLGVDHPNLNFADDWDKAAANPSAWAPETAMPIAANITFDGISGSGDKFQFGAEHTGIAGVRVYPWALLHPGLPTLSDVVATLGHQPQQPADLLLMLRLEAAYALGFGQDRQELVNYHGTAIVPATPGDDGSAGIPEQKITYSIANAESTLIDRGVFQTASATGIKFDSGAAGGGTVDRVHIDNVDFRKPAEALINNAPLAPAAANGLKVGAIGYDGIQFAVMGKPPTTIGSITISNIAVAGGKVASADMAVQSVKLNEDAFPNPQVAQVFDAVGLKSVTLSFGAGYRWQIKNKQIVLKDTGIKIDELGSLKLDGTAGNIDEAGAGLTAATLVHARLRYDDASLTQRLLAYGAKQAGTDEAGIRTLAIQTMTGAAAGFAKVPEIQQALKTATAFLAAPQNFMIVLKPAEPVPMMGLAGDAASPGDLVHKLGLVTRANTPQ